MKMKGEGRDNRTSIPVTRARKMGGLVLTWQTDKERDRGERRRGGEDGAEEEATIREGLAEKVWPEGQTGDRGQRRRWAGEMDGPWWKENERF